MTSIEAGKKSLERFIEAEDLKPNHAPTAIDIINFKNKLATALAKCNSLDRKKGGHIYLILSPEEYKEKVRNQEAIRLEAPTNPILREHTKEDPITAIEYKLHEKAEALYNDHDDYDRQTMEIIAQKFPHSLDGLRESDGELRLNLTAMEMINHLSDATDDDALVNTCYQDVLLNLLQRKYKSNRQGPESWFKEAEKDRDMSAKLGHLPIPHFLIMSTAQGAFRKSDIPKDKSREIDMEWKIKKAAAGWAEDTPTIFTEFKKHYTKALRLLHIDGNEPTKRAFQATEIEQMQGELRELSDNQHDMAVALSAVHNAVTTPSISGHSTPSQSTLSIPTTVHGSAFNATTGMTTAQFDQLRREVIAALVPTTNHQQPPTGRSPDPRGRQWKQYDKYCWSHGVNLSHHSNGCNAPKPGHDNGATYSDQRGGNTEKNHRWMKWNGPSGEITDQKGTH